MIHPTINEKIGIANTINVTIPSDILVPSGVSELNKPKILALNSQEGNTQKVSIDNRKRK